MASSIGIFEGWATHEHLYTAWSRRKGELEKQRFQPYADLLLDNIVWPQILLKKDAILVALQEKCKTASHVSELCVPIWSFNDTNDYPQKAQYVGGSADYDLQERARQIDENGWRQCLELLNDENPSLSRQPIGRIVKKTDFLEQLAVLFGGNFRVVSRPGDFKEETDPSGEKFWRFTVTLYLQYFPDGLLKYFQEARQKHRIAFEARLRQKLELGDKLVLTAAADEETIIYGPPRLFSYSHCFYGRSSCDCACDGYDSE